MVLTADITISEAFIPSDEAAKPAQAAGVTLSLSAVFFEIAPSAFEQDLEVQGR
jgi:hypothetical protein